MSRGQYPELPVLLVDDEESLLSSESKVLRAAGIDNLITCQDPREVIPLLEQSEIEAILLDIAMPHISGDVLLEEIRERQPQIPVIIITASDDIDVAVRCMKSGAFDYMVKAVEPSRLVSGLRRAIEMRQLSRRYTKLRVRMMADEISHPETFIKFVTHNRRMQAIFVFIESIAPTSEPVLIMGETGTGKELLAEAVHLASGRTGQLVTVNVASLDDTMFADTLFGHIKGAFTGADAARNGLVQQAQDGTLFLDEIGDLPLPSQIKLLRLIEKREYYQLGSDLIRSTNARFVVATHQNPAELVDKGLFRKDLYFRLHTHEIRIPPLRERKDDLPLLLDHFLEEAAENLSKKKLAVPPELLTLLKTYDFPGNVRELRSMVFSAVSRQKEKMLSMQPFREAMGRNAAHEVVPSSTEGFDFPDKLPTLKEITEMLIDEALARAEGNQAIAAGLLGLTPQALSKRLSRRRAG
jgi:DNA-binding NtrC family response regulator